MLLPQQHFYLLLSWCFPFWAAPSLLVHWSTLPSSTCTQQKSLSKSWLGAGYLNITNTTRKDL